MRSYIILFAAAVSLASCEKTIKVNVPEQPSKLALNSYTETYQKVTVQVGKSISILKYNKNMDLSVNNAAVTLYTDGVATETMVYDPTELVYKSNTVAEPGKTYSVKVSAPGFTDVESSTLVPVYVPMTSLKVIRNARVSIDGGSQDELRISFDDPVDPNDFYIVRFTSSGYYMTPDSGQGSYESSGCINTPDPSVETIYNEGIDVTTCLSGEGIFMRDDLFNGQTKELKLYIGSTQMTPYVPFPGDTIYPRIELLHVTEDYFRYIKTYRFAEENHNNPFAEPTNVYSNVKNGYGNFGIVSYHEILINE